MEFLLGLCFLIGGFAWRVRGESEPWGDTVARYVVWGVPVGLLVFAMTYNLIFGVVAIGLAGLGATVGYFGNFDVSQAINQTFKNIGELTLTAMLRFTPMLIAAGGVGLEWQVLPAVLAGILFAPIYWFAYKFLSKVTIGTLFNQPSCWAEFLFGGTIYLALAIGLYVGQ